MKTGVIDICMSGVLEEIIGVAVVAAVRVLLGCSDAIVVISSVVVRSDIRYVDEMTPDVVGLGIGGGQTVTLRM